MIKEPKERREERGREGGKEGGRRGREGERGEREGERRSERVSYNTLTFNACTLPPMAALCIGVRPELPLKSMIAPPYISGLIH